MMGARWPRPCSRWSADARLGPRRRRCCARLRTGCVPGLHHVDGRTRSNDTVLLLANGAAGGPPLAGQARQAFAVEVAAVCEQLAKAIPADGEGATHLVTIHVRGTQVAADARRIAKSVADSPLVKTAIAGADPNWGRIVSAAGYAGVAIDPTQISLRINQTPLYESGAPVPFEEADVQRSIRDHRETLIELEVGTGPASARFWTCDLTSEYIRLNADRPVRSPDSRQQLVDQSVDFRSHGSSRTRDVDHWHPPFRRRNDVESVVDLSIPRRRHADRARRTRSDGEISDRLRVGEWAGGLMGLWA